MDTSSRPLLTIDQLRAAHPGYEIEHDRRRDPPRYVASTHDLSLTPSAIVTPDLDELGRELAASRRPATAPGGNPVIRDRAAEIAAELAADWPNWEIWAVHRVIGGAVWCARRHGWQPGDIVLNASGPEELTELLEDQAQR